MGEPEEGCVKWFPKVIWLLVGKVRIQLAPWCLSENSFAERSCNGGLVSDSSCSPLEPGRPVRGGHARLTLLRGQEKSERVCSEPCPAGSEVALLASAKFKGSAKSNLIREVLAAVKHSLWSPSIWLTPALILQLFPNSEGKRRCHLLFQNLDLFQEAVRWDTP